MSQDNANKAFIRWMERLQDQQGALARRVTALESFLRASADTAPGETLTAEPDETLTAILEEVRGLRADLALREASGDGSYTITVTSLDGKTTTIKGVATPTRDNDAPDSLAALSRLVRQLLDDEVKKARRGAEDGR